MRGKNKERKRNVSSKRKAAALGMLALMLLAGASLEESQSYLTAYVEAEGRKSVELGTRTEIREEYEEGEKIVRIKNTGKTGCFVRVKAFAGSLVGLSYSGESWEEGEGGWWYYQKPLFPEEETAPLRIALKIPEKEEGLPEVLEVVVVEEHTPLQYQDGEPYGDWSLKKLLADGKEEPEKAGEEGRKEGEAGA